MRKLLTILLLIIPFALFGQRAYYFSNAGNDVTGDGTIGTPYVYVVAGDTSNVSVPGAVGDLFFDTSNSIIYGAISTTVGGWLRISNVP